MKENTQLNIFLDLEKTVIKDWFNPVFLDDNISIIKKRIEFFKDKFNTKNVSFHIFSHAICSDNDFKFFQDTLEKTIEEEFGIIESCFIASNENLFVLAKRKGLEPLEGDFPTDLFGNMKSETFEEFVKMNFCSQINILFDDTVENSIKTIFTDNSFIENNETVIVNCCI